MSGNLKMGCKSQGKPGNCEKREHVWDKSWKFQRYSVLDQVPYITNSFPDSLECPDSYQTGKVKEKSGIFWVIDAGHLDLSTLEENFHPRYCMPAVNFPK